MANSTSQKPKEAAEDPQLPKVQDKAPEGLQASGKTVKHLPHELFSARVISESDWNSIGIYGQSGVEWNESNGFQLPVEMFNQAALDYLEHRDDGFKVVGG
ncbi:hypothetical protein SEA_LILYPAD_18 [Gordonia phage LilyPad]|nr:hypothetical protein SEA_LILYPAD_18 [Gordonia phage LilyPad]